MKPILIPNTREDAATRYVRARQNHNWAPEWKAKLRDGMTADELDAADNGNPRAEQNRLTCDACGCTPDALARVGQEPDYDSATAKLCAACLREALALVEAPR